MRSDLSVGASATIPTNSPEDNLRYFEAGIGIIQLVGTADRGIHSIDRDAFFDLADLTETLRELSGRISGHLPGNHVPWQVPAFRLKSQHISRVAIPKG